METIGLGGLLHQVSLQSFLHWIRPVLRGSVSGNLGHLSAVLLVACNPQVSWRTDWPNEGCHTLRDVRSMIKLMKPSNSSVSVRGCQADMIRPASKDWSAGGGAAGLQHQLIQLAGGVVPSKWLTSDTEKGTIPWNMGALKHNNNCVFNGVSQDVNKVLCAEADEGVLWCAAGAKELRSFFF